MTLFTAHMLQHVYEYHVSNSSFRGTGHHSEALSGSKEATRPSQPGSAGSPPAGTTYHHQPPPPVGDLPALSRPTVTFCPLSRRAGRAALTANMTVATHVWTGDKTCIERCRAGPPEYGRQPANVGCSGACPAAGYHYRPHGTAEWPGFRAGPGGR